MRNLGIGCLLLLLFCGAAVAAGSSGVAIVKSAEGRVEVKRSGQLFAVAAGDHLVAGDLLLTGAGSRAGLIFSDGSTLNLGEKSLLRIKEFVFVPAERKFDFRLRLEDGTALFESGKIGRFAPEKFKFEIPEGTIGIRGTRFLVEVK
jgi:hypothetical protein